MKMMDIKKKHEEQNCKVFFEMALMGVKQELKDRITPQVNFFQQATKERQRRHGVSKKEKRDGEGLVWSKLCVDEYV